jgi:IclR family acetate operon transcriptional repressor
MKPTDRALSIFEAFEGAARPLTLSELAQAAGLPLSTSHGITRTLMQRGYLYLTSRRKDLYPTRKLYDIAAKINSHDPYLERFSPLLEGLRTATQETVIVGKRQADEIIYLAVYEGPQTIRYSADAGAIKPLHSTSIGKAMLSTVDNVALRAWLESRTLPAITSNTLTSTKALLQDIERGRARGFFVTSGESVSDVIAIAVPVLARDEVLGIAIAGPRHRMKQVVGRIAKQLLKARKAIEEQQ